MRQSDNNPNMIRNQSEFNLYLYLSIHICLYMLNSSSPRDADVLMCGFLAAFFFACLPSAFMALLHHLVKSICSVDIVFAFLITSIRD